MLADDTDSKQLWASMCNAIIGKKKGEEAKEMNEKPGIWNSCIRWSVAQKKLPGFLCKEIELCSMGELKQFVSMLVTQGTSLCILELGRQKYGGKYCVEPKLKVSFWWA